MTADYVRLLNPGKGVSSVVQVHTNMHTYTKQKGKIRGSAPVCHHLSLRFLLEILTYQALHCLLVCLSVAYMHRAQHSIAQLTP